MDTLLSLPLNYLLFIDMEKSRPISVAFDDIRHKPDIINHLEYRFINDDLGMVISFTQMGSKLFHTDNPTDTKEGRLSVSCKEQGESPSTSSNTSIRPQNHNYPRQCPVELLEISPDYVFKS